MSEKKITQFGVSSSKRTPVNACERLDCSVYTDWSLIFLKQKMYVSIPILSIKEKLFRSTNEIWPDISVLKMPLIRPPSIISSPS